jgi:hypothetical protein
VGLIMTDFEAIWFGQGAELARRMVALAAEMDIEGEPRAAEMIRGVLNCEYNPLPDQLPPLGDPPRLRPAVPGVQIISLPPPLGEHVARRAVDPGA